MTQEFDEHDLKLEYSGHFLPKSFTWPMLTTETIVRIGKGYILHHM